MAKRYCIITVLISICFTCVYACASLRYPPVEKELFSWQIPKNQVDSIKSTITTNGYKRITQDNYYSHNMSAIVTQYEKEVSTTAKLNNRVQIMLSFKEAGAPSGFYRNLGISIFNLDRDDIPEINDEVNKIEGLLYEKLLEVAGKENVVRGERGNTSSKKPTFFAPYVGRPPTR